MDDLGVTLSTNQIDLELSTNVINFNVTDTGPQGIPGESIEPKTETITLTSTNITNKYVDLTEIPIERTTVDVFPSAGIRQVYTSDFEVITDGTDYKRLSWSGLNLESLLEENDILIVNYLYTN